MERLTNERLAEIIRDKEICEFCEDCDNGEICINCEKINPATVAEIRAFWKELTALVKAKNEWRVLPEKSMWTATCHGSKLVLILDVKAAQEAEAAQGGGQT